MASRRARILILCKTYPSPSAKHTETSCVAGMEKNGNLIRLYPVPFRLIRDEKQFKKWQWITARIEKSKSDHRPESHKISVDTIDCDPKALPTRDLWRSRREAIGGLTVFTDFHALQVARMEQDTTLALLRPARITGLDITPTEQHDWTEEEKKKLLQLQDQGNLFEDRKAIATLKKVPFDFHYRYVCPAGDHNREYRHKIVDWEVGALYWNLRRSHGTGWEAPFRVKLERELPESDLHFPMGTIHRFPDQWLIVSLIYPPKRPPNSPDQRSLFGR